VPVFDHFEHVAPFYDDVIRLREPERLISRLGLPVRGRLLDAGGGTGRVAQALKGLASDILVADISLGMLRQAGEKDGLLRVCAPTERLPFPDGTFERILMVDALHHVINQKATARELLRVLMPGGRLVIEEPDVRTFQVKLVALAEKLALMRSHFLTPPAIAQLFAVPGVRTRVEADGFNAWVIVEK
jgi:ubiquinone/menaquinone biosynthesis C-methylase UbiE